MATQNKAALSERLKRTIAQYGPVAFAVYLVIFFMTFVSFTVAIRFGYRPESMTGAAGTLLAAYLATKAMQLPRILVTLALTPVVARVCNRWRGCHPPPARPDQASG